MTTPLPGYRPIPLGGCQLPPPKNPNGISIAPIARGVPKTTTLAVIRALFGELGMTCPNDALADSMTIRISVLTIRQLVDFVINDTAAKSEAEISDQIAELEHEAKLMRERNIRLEAALDLAARVLTSK